MKSDHEMYLRESNQITKVGRNYKYNMLYIKLYVKLYIKVSN